MEKDLKVKELKKELLELEERSIKDQTAKSNDSVVSGFIMIAVGAVCVTIGIANQILVSNISGIGIIIFGIFKMSSGKSSFSDFEKMKKVKEDRIITIKKELLDLE
jgi:uncharacterized membrane protein HdeD (DUF308 family)